MRCPYRNDDYRKHFAAHRRGMLAAQHDYDNKGPVFRTNKRGEEISALIRYASAMGRKLGLLPDDLSGYGAFPIMGENGGTARVYFTKGRHVKGRYGLEWKCPDQDETSIAVDIRFLDWVPAPATEETD